MKLVESYSTDIKDILELLNNDSIFISNWDKDYNILNFDTNIIEKSVHQRSHQNTYIMSKNMCEVKEKIINFFSKNNIKLCPNNFTIVSNGTCAATISILNLFQKQVSKFLCIGPIYFTYVQLLNILKKQLFYWDIDLFEKPSVDLYNLERELLSNDIKCIILIQPFLGSGVDFELSYIKKILSLCEKNKIYLIIDLIYGNMDWNTHNHLHNFELVKLVTASNYCILYESISKRIFLNGIKNSIIYSNANIIGQINRDSEICLGSMSYIQESLLDVIYRPKNLITTNSKITASLSYASNNYYLLQTLLINTDFQICDTTNGYFTLVAIPKKYFQHSDDKEITHEIFQKCNVLTIPHSRYYYNKQDYYCFRINLVLDTKDIIVAMQRILNICLN